jgi:putative ABC transport system substrate-binding protein
MRSIKRLILFFVVVWNTTTFVKATTVVIVKSQDIRQYNEAYDGFIEVLSQKLPAVNEVICVLKGEDKEADEVLNKIRQTKPDIIHTVGSSATELVFSSIKDIPIVFSMVLNPVASGLISSMESPGGNLTGAAMDIPIRSQFEYVRKVVPSVRTIGVLYNPQETGVLIKEADAVCRDMGLSVIAISVNSQKDVPDALSKLIDDSKIDLLWSVADGTVFSAESVKYVILTTLRSGIPFFGLSPSYVKAGALLALSCDARESGKRAAEIALKIISGGSPSSVSVVTPDKILLALNLRTCELLGIKIDKDIVGHADIVCK